MSKYKNTRTNGYASKKESNRADELKILERAGYITGLREQVVYVLAPSVVIGGRKRPPLRYIADFVYTQKFKAEIAELDTATYKKSTRVANLEKTIVEDVKGRITDAYRIKRHLMMSVHGIAILET